LRHERQYRGERRCGQVAINPGGAEMKRSATLFVGVDWAKDSHQVCVVGADATIEAERAVEHAGPSIAAFADWLHQLAGGAPERVAVAIEIPRGTVVETLIERGFPVYAINPKQLDRFRDRYSPAGTKDDRLDAYVLGDSLRTDMHCFRQVRMDDPDVIQLRELVRIADELRSELNRESNRLCDLLHRYYPQMLQVSSSPSEAWVLDLIELAPTPARVAKLRKAQVGRVLKRNRIRRITPSEVLELLRVPPLVLAEGSVEAASAHVGFIIPRLRLLQQQKKRVDKQIAALLETMSAPAAADAALQEATEGDSPEQRKHRDAEILLSLPGVGNVVAATMLAEAAWPLGERDYLALRAHAGVAPITRASGRKRRVDMRRACNLRLRNAVYHWARVATQHDPWAKNRYAALRARGHTHGRALRGLGDRLLNVACAMLRDGTLYDPARLRSVPATPSRVA
jgi:transposase